MQLQPKAKILVLTSSTGSGHDRRAYALKEWMEHECGDRCLVEVDHVLENGWWLTRFGVHIYNWIQLHRPGLHQVYWWVAEYFGRLQARNGQAGGEHYRQLLSRFQPRLILSVHDSTNRGYFEVARKILGNRIRLATYCGEYSGGYGYSHNWFSRLVDRYYSRTPEAEQYALSLGLSQEKSRIFANFLPRYFFRREQTAVDPEMLRRRLGLAPGKMTVFLATGGYGAADHLTLLHMLEPFENKIQAIVVCGKNEKLYQELQVWRRTSALQMYLEGYSIQMDELLRASDVVVTRGGANLTTEALFLGCPILFESRGGIMPQEVLTVNYFVPKGAAAWQTNNRGLAGQMIRWLEHPEELLELRRRFRALRPQDHMKDLADDLMRLAEENE